MEYHSLLFSKIRKDVANLSSAAVVIGALRVKYKAVQCKPTSNDYFGLNVEVTMPTIF